MTQPISLQLSPTFSRKVARRAKQEGVTPEDLIAIYLDYCLLRHADVIKFERQAGNPILVEKEKKQTVPEHLLEWVRSNNFKPL
jgi:hypothetical protein